MTSENYAAVSQVKVIVEVTVQENEPQDARRSALAIANALLKAAAGRGGYFGATAKVEEGK